MHRTEDGHHVGDHVLIPVLLAVPVTVGDENSPAMFERATKTIDAFEAANDGFVPWMGSPLTVPNKALDDPDFDVDVRCWPTNDQRATDLTPYPES